MNKDTIQIDKNTYAITTDTDNTRIISTLNTDNIEIIKNILLKENDVEEIDNKLKQYKEKLEIVKINTIYGETLNTFLYTILISLGIFVKPAELSQWIVLGVTETISYALVKFFNICAFSTRKNRKKKEAQENIQELEKLKKDIEKELEKTKVEANFTELTHLNEKTTNYTYIYKYNPNLCDFSQSQEEEKQKEIKVMKLTKMKKQYIQIKKLIKLKFISFLHI